MKEICYPDRADTLGTCTIRSIGRLRAARLCATALFSPAAARTVM